MSDDCFSVEELLLSSDNHAADVWASRHLDCPYPEAVAEWIGARQFFHESYVNYREGQCLGDQHLRLANSVSVPGSDVYVGTVLDALKANQVVLNSEWLFEGVRVKVPVLEKTSAGIAATILRSSKSYSRSGSEHVFLEEGLVAFALEANSVGPATVFSTRILNSETMTGFRHEFKPPIQNPRASNGNEVRAQISKLKGVLRDPMRPPENAEYCAVLDDPGLCSEHGALKRACARAGLDWSVLDPTDRVIVNRLTKSCDENKLQISGDFFESGRLLCFCFDVLPIRSEVYREDGGRQPMSVTPRAVAAAWNDENGKISTMFLSSNALRARSGKIAALRAKAGPFDERATFVETLGNVHSATRTNEWLRLQFGIARAKHVEGVCSGQRTGCVHPELVRNGCTLESWSKAFLATDLDPVSSRWPLKERLQLWADRTSDAALDEVLCRRAELLARGIMAAKKNLEECQSRQLTNEVSADGFLAMPIPVPAPGSAKIERVRFDRSLTARIEQPELF